jgi:hypothetical protein
MGFGLKGWLKTYTKGPGLRGLPRILLLRLSEKSGQAPNRSATSRQNGPKDPYFAVLCHQSLTIEKAYSPFSDSLTRHFGE